MVATLQRLDYEPRTVHLHECPGDPRGFRVNACVKEPWTVQFIEDMPGQPACLYDVGANVGSYTCLAGVLGKFVVAFEPATWNYAALVDNLRVNNLLSQTIPLQLALSNTNRLDWINYGNHIQAGGADHTIGGAAPGNIPVMFHRQAIMFWRLDDLIQSFGLPPATHMKVDVDGGEVPVLDGMPRTLDTVQALMLEMKPEQETMLVERIKGHGLEPVGRWDRRGGQLTGVVYIRFARVRAATGA